MTGDNIPGNVSTGVDLNNGGWILIGILIALLLIVSFITIYINFKSKEKIHKLNEFIKTKLSEEEQKLINNFRKLNPQGKAFINDTCKTLTNNQTINKNDGI